LNSTAQPATGRHILKAPLVEQAYSAQRDSVAEFQWPTSMGNGGEETEGKERNAKDWIGSRVVYL